MHGSAEKIVYYIHAGYALLQCLYRYAPLMNASLCSCPFCLL